MKKKNVRLVIADGDTQPAMRLIIRAARTIGAPSIIFAHGYIQNPQLVSIAPIYGDYLITWTEQQANDLKASISGQDAEKVRFFGYPKDTYLSAGRDDLVLIVWHPFANADRERQIQTILSVARQLKAAGYDARLRLHPKDGKAKDLCKAFENEGLDVSTSSLAEDIGSAGVVVGSRSSVLIEAAMSGKRVYQLADQEVSFEGITQFSPTADIAEIVKRPSSVSPPPPFDHSRFSEFLDSVVNSH